MQPPIIHLSGHAGFMVIPPMEQFFTRTRTLERNMSRCLILDLSSVRQMETCVARFLAKVVSDLAAESTPGVLIIVKPRGGLDVFTSLSRGGLHLQQLGGSLSIEPLPYPPATSVPVSCSLCENLEQAIAVCRGQTQDTPSSSSVVLRPIDRLQEGFPSEFIESIIDELSAHLPQSYPTADSGSVLPAYERMRLAGLGIREIQQGSAISCPRYPVQPTFMVLRGLVALEKLHAECPGTTPQQPIRDAVRSGVILAFRSLRTRSMTFFQPRKRSVETNTLSEFLKPFAWFDRRRSASYCAYAAEDSCWILEIDPGIEAGVKAVDGLARRFTATKY